MQTFLEFRKAIFTCKDQNDFSKYLESSYIEFEEYFENLSLEKLNELKFEIEDLLYDLESENFLQDKNSEIVNAFLILLAQRFEQVNMLGAISNILNYLPESAIKDRFRATVKYLKVNDISKDYENNFDIIISLIASGLDREEYRYKILNAIVNFYMTAMENFVRVDNEQIAAKFVNLFDSYSEKYPILNDTFITSTIKQVTFKNFLSYHNEIKEKIRQNGLKKVSCDVSKEKVEIEQSTYSEHLYSLTTPNFRQIRQFAFDYIKKIGDPYILFEQLNRGETIIYDEALLYKYLVSFGTKHKAKLYDAFETIKDKIKNLRGEKFNIVDWGCGQAFGIMMLLEYAKENSITLNISNICLIEPSKLALSRGLLHVDVLRQDEYSIKAVNSDLDCLKQEDITFENNYKTLHLFSNILDVESFSLNTNFLKLVSACIKNDSIFVCVSPNINDKRNARLDLFYKHFDENFNSKLLSSRDDDVAGHKRYEKIFEVKPIDSHIIEEKRQEIQEIQKNYQFDIMKELNQYKAFVSPILDLKMLENSIESDPEYVIFKIRKVAEVITSQIYSQYESNAKIVSFNDKIRYLSYEKNLFDKTITNYIQTLRTIGNRGVHESERANSKLKLDAHLMIIALISFLNEILEKKIIS